MSRMACPGEPRTEGNRERAICGGRACVAASPTSAPRLDSGHRHGIRGDRRGLRRATRVYGPLLPLEGIMRIDVRPCAGVFATLVALGGVGCSGREATRASSAGAAAYGTPDPSAADPSTEPAPSPPVSPAPSSPPASSPPAQGTALAVKSPLWSLDRGGVDAARTTDGLLAVFAAGDLFTVDDGGKVVSDEPIDSTQDAKVAALATLSLVRGALAGDAVR